MHPKQWWSWQPKQNNYTSWRQDVHALSGERSEDLTCFLVATILSKKRLVLDLNTTVEVTEASEKDKLTVKQVMAKFNGGETWSVWHVKM